MPSAAALAKIHIAKKDLGLSDDAYRDLLRLHFGVESARDLQPRQIAVLLNQFRAKGWRPKTRRAAPRRKPTADDSFIRVKSGPAAAQQRKVLALWAALGYDMAKLHTRCKQQFEVERIEWLTGHNELHVLITDLQARLDRQRRQSAIKP